MRATVQKSAAIAVSALAPLENRHKSRRSLPRRHFEGAMFDSGSEMSIDLTSWNLIAIDCSNELVKPRLYVASSRRNARVAFDQALSLLQRLMQTCYCNFALSFSLFFKTKINERPLPSSIVLLAEEPSQGFSVMLPLSASTVNGNRLVAVTN